MIWRGLWAVNRESGWSETPSLGSDGATPQLRWAARKPALRERCGWANRNATGMDSARGALQIGGGSGATATPLCSKGLGDMWRHGGNFPGGGGCRWRYCQNSFE